MERPDACFRRVRGTIRRGGHSHKAVHGASLRCRIAHLGQLRLIDLAENYLVFDRFVVSKLKRLAEDYREHCVSLKWQRDLRRRVAGAPDDAEIAAAGFHKAVVLACSKVTVSDGKR